MLLIGDTAEQGGREKFKIGKSQGGRFVLGVTKRL